MAVAIVVKRGECNETPMPESICHQCVHQVRHQSHTEIRGKFSPEPKCLMHSRVARRGQKSEAVEVTMVLLTEKLCCRCCCCMKACTLMSLMCGVLGGEYVMCDGWVGGRV